VTLPCPPIASTNAGWSYGYPKRRQYRMMQQGPNIDLCLDVMLRLQGLALRNGGLRPCGYKFMNILQCMLIYARSTAVAHTTGTHAFR
jgi:hypothetical protein